MPKPPKILYENRYFSKRADGPSYEWAQSTEKLYYVNGELLHYGEDRKLFNKRVLADVFALLELESGRMELESNVKFGRHNA